MTRWLVLLMLVASPAFAQTRSSEDEAGNTSEVDKDSSGPLRDRIRPVSGKIFSLTRRFEIAPDFGVSFKDAFYTKYTAGLQLAYFFTESFGVSLRGAWAFPIVSGAAIICDPVSTTGVSAGCRQPTFDELAAKSAYGQMGLLAGLGLQWAPIYGKLGLFGESFLHFSMYGSAGPAILTYGPAGTFTAGGDLAIGVRIVGTRWLAVRTELRDVLYSESASATKSSFRNQLFFHLGLSFFFPTAFEE